ncbi:MAG: hypothetical protein R2825_04880 [Saprospiraceae bacterium]
MAHNLPVINYSENHKTQMPIRAAHGKAIVQLDDKLGVVKR